jgi:hypothetical protein
MSLQPEEQQITFPVQHVQVANDGVVVEVFFSPTASFKVVIPENQVNELMKLWLQTRQQLQKQQQLITDVMRSKLH